MNVLVMGARGFVGANLCEALRNVRDGKDRRRPHFHAYYQGDSATFDLDGNLLEGALPHKQASYVVAWAGIHHDELVADWELAEAKEEVFKIDPLR